MRALLYFLLTAIVFTGCQKKYATHDAVDLPQLIPYHDDGRWGFADSTGDIQIKAKYDSVSFFHYGLAKVYLNKDGWKRMGYINEEGELVLPIEYDDIRWLDWEKDLPFLPIQKGESFGIINRRGRIIVPCNYHDVDFHRSGYFIVTLNRDNVRNYGVYDSSGKIIFEPVYRAITSDMENKRQLYAVAFNEKFGLFDKSGNPLTGFDYEAISVLNTRNAAYHVNTKVFTATTLGILDDKGNRLTEPLYTHAYALNDSFILLVRKENQELFTAPVEIIDYKGTLLHKGEYYRAEKKGTSRLILSKLDANFRTKYALSNLRGDIIIPFEYDHIIWQNGGRLIVRRDSLSAVLDSNGKEIIPFKYHNIYPLKDLYYNVLNAEGLMGTYNYRGRKILNPEFEIVDIFRDSLLKAKKGSRYSYFYPNGAGISPRKMYESFYDSFTTYDMGKGVTFWQELPCGRFIVIKEDRFYMTDTEGKLDKKNDFDSIRRFQCGLSIYTENGLLGLIDSLGNVLTKPKYQHIAPFSNGTSIVYGLNKSKDVYLYGLVDYKGKSITDLKYEKIEAWRYGLFRVYGANNKFLGLVDYRGQEYFDE